MLKPAYLPLIHIGAIKKRPISGNPSGHCEQSDSFFRQRCFYNLSEKTGRPANSPQDRNLAGITTDDAIQL
jgi:hypothetical protein